MDSDRTLGNALPVRVDLGARRRLARFERDASSETARPYPVPDRGRSTRLTSASGFRVRGVPYLVVTLVSALPLACTGRDPRTSSSLPRPRPARGSVPAVPPPLPGRVREGRSRWRGDEKVRFSPRVTPVPHPPEGIEMRIKCSGSPRKSGAPCKQTCRRRSEWVHAVPLRPVPTSSPGQSSSPVVHQGCLWGRYGEGTMRGLRGIVGPSLRSNKK